MNRKSLDDLAAMETMDVYASQIATLRAQREVDRLYSMYHKAHVTRPKLWSRIWSHITQVVIWAGICFLGGLVGLATLASTVEEAKRKLEEGL